MKIFLKYRHIGHAAHFKKEKNLPEMSFLLYSRVKKGRDEVMKPLLLCVHMEPVRLMRISLLAASLGIAVREVKEEQWGQTLEALCGPKPAGPAGRKANIGGEMAVMAFFPEGLIDALSLAIRKNGLERPRLMAVLTPTNRSWTCERLYRELQKEYTALNARK